LRVPNLQGGIMKRQTIEAFCWILGMLLLVAVAALAGP
jgi:hypothetical protein